MHGLKFMSDRFKVDRGGSNICIFYRLCKALMPLLIICPKKFLQESMDHLSNIQPTRSLIDLKVSHMVKINFIHGVLYYSELYAFEIKLFRIHRTTQYFPKSFQQIFRDCKTRFECFKGGRMICFCMRGSQTRVTI